MTLSIIAYDGSDDVVGAAVTSCALAAGRRILHVRAGVGAAVAQASSEIPWGEELLDSLALGHATTEAIASFSSEGSQVAVINFRGEVAAHTGGACAPHSGMSFEPGLSVQVNTAALPDAVERMVAAYHVRQVPLAERLVAALAASGDDRRGRQSAAVVVSGRGPLRGYADEPHVDLRVDDHRDPVGELSRLLRLHRAHCTMRLTTEQPPGDRLAILDPLLKEHPADPHLRRAVHAAKSTLEGTDRSIAE